MSHDTRPRTDVAGSYRAWFRLERLIPLATVALAFFAQALAVFQIIVLDITESIILAILGLLAFDALAERINFFEKLRQDIKAIQDQRHQTDGLLIAKVDQLGKDVVGKVGAAYFITDPTDGKPNVSGGDIYYKKLGEVVSQANFEILALALAATNDRNFRPSDPDARRDYYTLLENIIEHHQNKFKYVRIFQMPNERRADPAHVVLESVVREHAKKVYEIKQGQETNIGLDIAFQKIQTQRLTGFIIVDRRILIIIVGGLTEDGHPYHKGAIIFERSLEDPLIQEYYEYFSRLYGRSLPIDYRELV